MGDPLYTLHPDPCTLHPTQMETVDISHLSKGVAPCTLNPEP